MSDNIECNACGSNNTYVESEGNSSFCDGIQISHRCKDCNNSMRFISLAPIPRLINKDNIDYSKFDVKSCIKQALHHSSKIDSLYDGNRDQHFFSHDHMANVLHSMWFEHENIKRQLHIMSEKCK